MSCLRETRRHAALTYLSGCVALTLAVTARAQTVTPDKNVNDQSRVLEEIVVSAARAGDIRLQDVPMAISVVEPEDLRRAGLSSMVQFLDSVPAVHFEEDGPGVNRILVRGLVNQPANVTYLQDRTLVSVYLDDTPISLNGQNPDIRAVDLERVEVLRGPQGTLYGAGAMAGTVRFITVKPDSTKWSGSLEGATEFTDGGDPSYNLRGSLNAPIAADKAALMVSAFYEDAGGWINNIGLGEDNQNSAETFQSRAALRLTPTENLTIDVSAMGLFLDSQGNNDAYRELDFQNDTLTREGIHDNLGVYNLTANYVTSLGSLISSTSYLNRRFNVYYNLEALSETFFGERRPSPSILTNRIENFTQEFRFLTETGPFKFQVGAFYGNDERDYTQDVFYEGLDELIGIPSQDLHAPYPDQSYYSRIETKDEQWAIFGEATWSMTSALDLTVGLRYFDFKGPASIFQGGIAGIDVDGSPLAVETSEQANGVSPRFVAMYKINPDLNVFMEAAKGFRYGGVNYPVPLSFCGDALAEQGLTSAPQTFGPDETWTYTLGEKAQLLDRRLTLNSSLFLIEWKDAQTNHPLDCGFPFTENKGELQSRGFELETVFNVTDSLTLFASTSYTDTTSTRSDSTLGIEDGDRAPFFPEWSASVRAAQSIEVGLGTILFDAAWAYRSSITTDFNEASSYFREVPSAHMVNLSANYVRNDWEAGLYIRNLTDDEQIRNIGPATYAASIGDLYTLGQPRTIGLRLAKKF
jgi:outer membrane receptor protein involved in Fe transport